MKLDVRRSILTTLLVVAVAGCGASASPSPSGSAAPSPSAPTSPSAEPSPSTPDASGSPAPSPSSSPAGPSASPSSGPTAWTKPKLIGAGSDCSALAAAIDESGGYHVAAQCGGRIRYSASRKDGSWTTATFGHPAKREDWGPQVAFEGNRLVVAYTRIALQDEGCGGIGIKDIGVYYRSRDLPSGTWSEPQQVGQPTDSLLSLRVAGGSLHLLVIDPQLNVFYETVDGATVHRYKVGESFGGAALRIGSDGRARITYESANSIKFGVFTGSGFSTSTIPGSTNAQGPSLVLDAQNHAHVVWTRTNQGGGCAEPEPDPKEGMYYATDASGTWRTTRFTKSIGEASMTVDVKTGRVHILFAAFEDRGGLRYYTKAANGGWTAKRILTGRAFSPVLRLDPSTGTLLAAFVDDTVGHAGIYIMTKAGG